MFRKPFEELYKSVPSASIDIGDMDVTEDEAIDDDNDEDYEDSMEQGNTKWTQNRTRFKKLAQICDR